VPGHVPVGYSNKGGLIMNLLRDDLGTNDPNSLHYENQYSRGVPPGEYTVNLRLFRNLESRYSVPVEVTVRCSAEKSPRNIVNTKVQMNREGKKSQRCDSGLMSSAIWSQTPSTQFSSHSAPPARAECQGAVRRAKGHSWAPSVSGTGS
jgi:hypothetical protein